MTKLVQSNHYFVQFIVSPSRTQVRILGILTRRGSAWTLTAKQDPPKLAWVDDPKRVIKPAFDRHLGFVSLTSAGTDSYRVTPTPPSGEPESAVMGSWLISCEPLSDCVDRVWDIPPKATVYFYNDKFVEGPYLAVAGAATYCNVVPVDREWWTVKRLDTAILPEQQVVDLGRGWSATVEDLMKLRGDLVGRASQDQGELLLGRLLSPLIGRIARSSQGATILKALLDSECNGNFISHLDLPSYGPDLVRVQRNRVRRFVEVAEEEDLEHSILQRFRTRELKLALPSSDSNGIRDELARARQQIAALEGQLGELRNAEQRLHGLNEDIRSREERLRVLDGQAEAIRSRLEKSTRSLIHQFAAHSILFSELRRLTKRQRRDKEPNEFEGGPVKQANQNEWVRHTLMPLPLQPGIANGRAGLATHLALASSPFTITRNLDYILCYLRALGPAGRLFHVYCSPVWVDWQDACKHGLARPWRIARSKSDQHSIILLRNVTRGFPTLWIHPLVDLAGSVASEVPHLGRWPKNVRVVILLENDGAATDAEEHKNCVGVSAPPIGSAICGVTAGVESFEQTEGETNEAFQILQPSEIMWGAIRASELSLSEGRERRFHEAARRLDLSSTETKVLQRRILEDWPTKLLREWLEGASSAT